MHYFPLAIVKDDGMDNYAGVFPDVSGCFPLADSIDEIIVEAQSLLYAHIETMLEHNMPFDFKTSSIDQLQQDEEYQDVITWAMIAIDETKLSTKQVRFNVSWSEHLLKRVDEHIAKTHDTRSGFLAKAVTQAMNHQHTV